MSKPSLPKPTIDSYKSAMAVWTTNNRITEFLLENVPDELWRKPPPGEWNRTIAQIAVHLHNIRRMWTVSLGKRAEIAVPPKADRLRATRRGVLKMMKRSSRSIVQLLELGFDRGGKIPGFPPDVYHFLAYFVAHEAHHRGQICALARQMGHRLPTMVAYGLWHWQKRAKEVG